MRYFRAKKLFSTTIALLLSTTHHSIFASPFPRATQVSASSADFSTGFGLNGGNIPEGAVKLGLMLIPDGASLNNYPNLAPITFQKINNIWVAQYNNVNIQGTGNPAYFSVKAINPDNLEHMKTKGNQVSWEDLSGGGDLDYDDAVLNVTVQRTDNNNLISISGGTYDITNLIKFQIKSDSIVSEAGYNNSFGHYFADANGNLMSGTIHFRNVKDTLGVGGAVTLDYGYVPFVSGSTLQYNKAALALANIPGVNIAAIDIGLAGGGANLEIRESASLGSVVNSLNNASNLAISILPDKILSLTGTGGVFYNGAIAAPNNYKGLKSINGTASSKSTLEFINTTSEMRIPAPIGASGRLESLKMSGKTVELTSTLATDKIEFTNSDQISALELFGNVDLGGTDVTTSSTQRIHNIHISVDQNITGNIGSETNKFGTIKILKNNAIKINTLGFRTDVNTLTDNTGSVEFTKAKAISYSLGDAEHALKEIKFSHDGEVQGSAYAETIIIRPGKTASFVKRAPKPALTLIAESLIIPYVRTTKGLVFEGGGGKAFFGDLAAIRGPILTNVAGQGTVTFEGNAEVRGDIGTQASRVDNVTFQANTLDKNVILARDIHSKTIIFQKSHVIIDKGGTLDGTTTIDSTNIAFGQHIMLLTGGNTTVTGNPALDVYFDNTSNSHLTITGNGNNLNFAKANTLTFNMSDYSLLPPAAGRTFNFFRAENGGTITLINPNNVTVNQPLNPFVQWSYDNGVLKQARDVSGGLQKLVLAVGGNTNQITQALILADPNSQGSALRFINDLSAMATTDVSKAGAALNQFLQAVTPTGPIVINTTKSAQSAIIAARLNNTNFFEFRVAEGETQGVSAGEELSSREYGPWVSPFYTQSVQKQKDQQSGYKSRAWGGSVGVDSKINDTTMLGGSVTLLQNKIKYKDVKTGDKSKIDSWIFSIYGLHFLTPKWFMQGIASVGFNKVKNTKARLTSIAVDLANSSYSSRTYGGELFAGYNHEIAPQTKLVPMIGIRYAKFVSDKYQEKNATNVNLAISKKTVNKLEAVAGVKLAKQTMINNIQVIPEIHGFINYDLNATSPNIDVRLDGMVKPMSVKVTKPPRTVYTFGGGVVAKHKMMEYEIGYDANVANKYISHQGIVKIRVNF